MHYFPYWDYYAPDLHPLLVILFDDFDVYPVITYLFIQWLPHNQSFWRMFSYWFVWTGIAIIIEYIHVATGHMAHLNGWAFWHSYLADWFLFWLFYQYHRIFELKST